GTLDIMNPAQRIGIVFRRTEGRHHNIAGRQTMLRGGLPVVWAVINQKVCADLANILPVHGKLVPCVDLVEPLTKSERQCLLYIPSAANRPQAEYESGLKPLQHFRTTTTDLTADDLAVIDQWHAERFIQVKGNPPKAGPPRRVR